MRVVDQNVRPTRGVVAPAQQAGQLFGDPHGVIGKERWLCKYGGVKAG